MRRKQLPLVSFILLGLNVLGFIYEYTEGERLITYQYGMYQGALEDGEWFRILTSAFLHFGIAHLACNMFCLVSFGFALEKRIGPWKYLLIYAVAIAGSGLLVNYQGGNGLHAGASGAIWGLMTATLIYDIRNNLNAFEAIRCIVINLVYSFSANVSWQGHIGGGIAGLIAALVMFRSQNGSSGQNKRISHGNQNNIRNINGGNNDSIEYWH